MDDTERAHWLAERAGKLTASRMKDAMDFLKNGKPSEKRSAYMRELLAERMTDLTVRHFVTPAMEHGLACEDEAKRAYEAATGNLLADSRFYEHRDIPYFGATPDAEIAGGGLAEFKCPTTTTFLEWVLAGVVPETHKPQMIAQLLCTGRDWCEFVAYDPRIKDENRRLFVRRYVPDDEERAEVDHGARVFLDELDALFEQLTTAQAA